MGKSKKIAIENYQKFQSVAHWAHRSEKIKSAKNCCPLVSLLPIGLTHCMLHAYQTKALFFGKVFIFLKGTFVVIGPIILKEFHCKFQFEIKIRVEIIHQ
jgi:hypothetical protein